MCVFVFRGPPPSFGFVWQTGFELSDTKMFEIAMETAGVSRPEKVGREGEGGGAGGVEGRSLPMIVFMLYNVVGHASFEGATEIVVRYET